MTDTGTTDHHLDGNAAAGALSEVFAVEITSAIGQCAGCGRTGPMAETRLYANAPGLVLRCAGCDAVLLRLVGAEGRRWLDLRGLAYLQLAGS
jgi:Family of unknown function (DUF6510)